jgi:1D-myo-inositol-tetrakisphosphate 5-kinase/inositol-polyphosphate multikinase
LLTLEPDYVLKPLQLDHRGIREIGFYEAVRTACQKGSVQSYAAFTGGSHSEVTQPLDVLAMYITLSLGDESLAGSEQRISNSWRKLKKEVELLRRLQKYTALYYGVVEHNYVPSATPSGEKTPYGVSVHSHLLLQDLTCHFSKPCVIDIKIGPQTYEPDAPEEKKAREVSKYPQQTEFGFRIVGMRIYDTSHEDACENGYLFFSKEFGRSLSARDALKSAFRTYLSAGINTSQSKDAGGTPSTIRTRSLSNILTQIRSIQSWFDDNIYFCFYASSLLIVYEGDSSDSSTANMVNVKMIDFGRVRRQAGGDPGYSLGLKTIREILVELMEEQTTAA